MRNPYSWNKKCSCGQLIQNHSKHCNSCANKKSIKKRLKNRRSYKGNLNPNYIHGLGYAIYPIKFNKKLKVKIFKRDGFTCQKCLKYPTNDLNCHHIDYDKQNCTKENLITLCFKCNINVNKNRDYWYAYFMYIMENK